MSKYSKKEMLDLIYQDPICHMRDDYYECLYDYASQVPEHGTIVEIGTMYGASALALLCGSHDSVKVYCIDPLFRTGHINYPDAHNPEGWTLNYSLFDIGRKFSNAGLSERVIIAPHHSWLVLETWNTWIDLLFVDGEHTYNAVKKDCEWLQWVKPGGMAAFDDWFDEIENAVKDSILYKPEWKIIYESTTEKINGMCVTLLRKSL